MTTDMTKEIKALLESYKTAPKEKRSKIRRSLRAKGFSLRAWNKENKPVKKVAKKVETKPTAKVATPKAPKAVKPTKVAKPVTVPSDDESEA